MLLLALSIVVGLILLNGVFSMCEMAVVSSRKARLQTRAEHGDKGASAALALSQDPGSFFSAVQIGITLIGILAGAYGQATVAAELDAVLTRVPALRPYSQAIATALVVFAITYLSLVVGELVPKRLAILFPEAIASRMARPLQAFTLAVKPFIVLLAASTSGVLRLFRIRQENADTVTEEEVHTVIAEGVAAGAIEEQEHSMIRKVLRLNDLRVRSAMTPRRKVYWISVNDPAEVILSEIRNCPYSRIVVAGDGGIDEPIGIVHKKDLLDQYLEHGDLRLDQAVRAPLSILERTSVLRALDLFKGTQVHMAFVVDEFGGFEGVVTPLDLLERIAGDFPEAHDTEARNIIPREDGSLLVDALVGHAELGDRLGINLSNAAPGTYHTVAGLLTHRLARLPDEGEIVEIAGYLFEVVDMDGPRIDKVLVRPIPQSNGAVDLSRV